MTSLDGATLDEHSGSDHDIDVLIIGGGLFGLCTAMSLAQGRYLNKGHKIMIIDRAANPPEADAASSDINKIVRGGDYPQRHYAELSITAAQKWTTEDFWKKHFHPSGFMALASVDNDFGRQWMRSSFGNLENLHKEGLLATAPVKMTDNEQFKTYMGAKHDDHGTIKEIPVGEIPPHAYFNSISGWCHATGSMQDVAEECRKLGVRFVAGQVKKILLENNEAKGAELEDGRVYSTTKLLVLAAGGWTPGILPELSGKLEGTGHYLATIQLTPEEAEKYSKIPVLLDESNGFHIFPPNAENKVKFVMHDSGFFDMQPSLADPEVRVSLPRTKLFRGTSSENIPKQSVKMLREGLRRFWPELADKPFAETRMCWYCDSEDGEFLIDYHDRYKNLFLATAGSGHAFKFAPVIGDLCAQAIEGVLPEHLKEAWSFTRKRDTFKQDRVDTQAQALNVSDFATAEDLRTQE